MRSVPTSISILSNLPSSSTILPQTMATAEVPCGLTRSISLVGNHCNKATQSDVSRTEWGREWCVGMTGGGRELFSDLQTKLLNAAVRERERVAARGLINTESTASSEWVILIQRHYHPAITLPIQPETSSAELLRLFSPWIIWGHDSLLTPSECTSTFSA